MAQTPYLLALQGSPRKKGNTEILLDEFLAGAVSAGASVETIVPSRLKISGCLECGGCDQTASCVIDDDMQPIYPKLLEADIIVIASPLFFMGPPAQLKALIDRLQALWVGKYKLGRDYKKPGRPHWGFLMGVGALKGWDTFKGLKMVAAGLYFSLDLESKGNILIQGVDGKGEVEQKDAYHEARASGAALVREWCEA